MGRPVRALSPGPVSFLNNKAANFKSVPIVEIEYLEIGTFKNYEILCNGSLLNYLSNGTGPTLFELILVKW